MRSHKKHKQIHIISKYFYPVAAGIETNIMETYAVLAESGWNITIHTSADTLTEKNCLPKKEVIRNITVKRYKFTWNGYFPKINWDKADIVALHNFNVVPHLYVMLYSMYLKFIGRKKFALVLTPHGGFNPEWRIFSKFVARIKRFYHFTVGTFMINASVDGVRAVSEWERNEIVSKRVLSNKVVVISNGIEDEAYMNVELLSSPEIKAKVREWGTYIIQVGRVYPIKNYETTIRALALLPAHINYVIVGPVGDEDYKTKLINLTKELQLENRVFFAGVIRGVDKYFVIKKAQMMVHMAMWESFCNVVHEGLSQALPCIVANNTALPLLVKDGVNGYCVETNDYLTVASKIKYILEHRDTEEIREMMEKNRAFGLQMSWRMVAEKMDQLYHSLTLKNGSNKSMKRNWKVKYL